MKNNNIRILLIIIILSVISCKDYFEIPKVSSFEPGNIFTNVEYTKKAIIGIYQLMTRDEGYSKRVSMYYGVDTDVAMCTGDLDNGRRGIAKYAATSGNEEIEKPWNNFYKMIERANICIANIPESPLYKNGTEDEQTKMKRMYGEALTLRALSYYELVRNWGDVPFLTEPAKVGDDYNQPKTDRDTIYEHIINDLLLADTLVPWFSEIPEIDERITKGAVKGLLARICLARAGYSLRRDGKNRQGTNPEKYYKIARDQCLEVIQSGEHDLNEKFEDVFKRQCEWQLETTRPESMWEVAMGIAVSGELGYYLGTKIDDNNQIYGKGNPGMIAMPTYFLSFNLLDTRRDVTIGIYEIDNDNKKLLRSFSDINIAKWRRDWMNYPGTAKYTGVNWVLLRFSDILLMFAEAENELNNGPTNEAKNALKYVRERAFYGNEDKIPTIPDTKDEFFNAIVQERAWEFGGECLRKHDLIRWNLLGTKIDETKENLRKLYDGEPPYENVPRIVAWNNDGDGIEYLNLHAYMDSTQWANRDSINYPNQTDWADNILSDFISTFAQYFQPEQKELLPIHQSIIDVNTELHNDYGY